MNILEHRAIPGPNHHSPYPTVLMRLDLEELADTPSNAIPGFVDRLLAAMPTLGEHRCSAGHPGGFVERLRDGTWAGHIVEHVAIELQCLAGLKVGFGKTRETSRKGVYTVVYRYREQGAGLAAGRMAVTLVEDVADGREADVAGMVAELRERAAAASWGPSTMAVVREARRRGIPVTRLDDGSYLQLGHGARQQRMQASLTGRTSCIGAEIADDKQRTKAILREAGIPVPFGEVVRSVEGALEAAAEIGYPVVVKPLVGNHGRGVATDIADEAALRAAYDVARDIDRNVIVEKLLVGEDFRVLVVNHRFTAAARRDPAQVVGDGVHTIDELIARANADPRRGEGHDNWLTRIEADEDTARQLAAQGLTAASVPAPGAVVCLKGTANLSTGGTATDVTMEVHPRVRRMCERASRLVGLDLMGIDIVAPNLREPLEATGGAVVEVNAAPGLRMHAQPSEGRPRNVAAPILDMLFPGGGNGRIPIVAVTGTNGKTTTVRLVAHILGRHGANVGVATTSGVEINGETVLEGDYSGPDGARAVLADPWVDHAVLEVARGGILRRGLGFDQCDVGILLNVASDHLGESGVETLEDLAEVKAVVVENVSRKGTAVLNADDPLVASYAGRLRSNVTLFSLAPESALVEEHIHRAGTVVTVADGHIVVRDRNGDEPIVDVQDVAITMGGLAQFNVQNALAAVAACRALGVGAQAIREALESFKPTPATLPGRLNLVDLGEFRALVDYGHNVAAIEALAPIVRGLGARRRITMANASGNRRDDDIRAFGHALGGLYDRFVLCDPDPRRRPPGQTMGLLREGILDSGVPADAVENADSEEAAIDRALGLAEEGDLVVLQPSDVALALARVEEWRTAMVARAGPRMRPARRPREAASAPTPTADAARAA